MDEALNPQDLQDDITLKLYEDDEGALADILSHYSPPLMEWLKQNYVYREGPLNIEDVEDIVCIAVRKLWDARKSYDDKKASVRTWLFRIADNTAKDMLKEGWHKLRQKERYIEREWLEDQLVEERHPNQAVPDVGNCEEDEELFRAVQDTLSGLRDEYRKILMCDAKADGEANSAEIGRRLGDVPAGTVRVWRSRAKAAFCEGMKKRGYDLKNLGD